MERRKSLFKNRRKTIAFYDTVKEESEPEIEEFEEVKLPVIHHTVRDYMKLKKKGIYFRKPQQRTKWENGQIY